MAETARKTKDDYGTPYRGHEGQWSWLFHRVTGVGIILFLFAHVIDTAVVGWGPEAYNRVVAVYENPFVRVLEYALVEAVLFHAINGLRIMVIDFVPAASAHVRTIGRASMGLFLAATAATTWIMGRQIWELVFV